MKIKRQINNNNNNNNNKNIRISVFGSFLSKSLQIYKQRYHNNNNNNNTAQKHRSNFNNCFMTICEFLYSYMKQLTTHINKQFTQQKDNNNKNSIFFFLHNNKQQMLQQISMNYIKLFSAVLKWPSMLQTMIQKLKGEFQILTNTQIAQSIGYMNRNSININPTSSKSLLDNLIIINSL